MADAPPTIRPASQSGTQVLEVSGTWTVFSIRDLKVKKGARRPVRISTKSVDASNVGRLDTAGVIEILDLAGGGPETEVKTSNKNHADLFKVVQSNLAKEPTKA